MRFAFVCVMVGSVAWASSGSVSATSFSSEGYGPTPDLPPPERSWFTTVNLAHSVRWQDGRTPHPARGLAVTALATGLDHPRWLCVLPDGDVLVAETNAPPRYDPSLRDWIVQQVKSYVGAGVRSANRITLLRDSDGDGVAELRTTFLENLNSPFGMALVGHDLYVAATDAILRFPYEEGMTRIAAPATKLVDLPAGDINYHWTKTLLASPDGTRLYVSIGSNSDFYENGIEVEAGRAAIDEIDLASGQSRPFASGLRNPVGLAWQPRSGALWTTVNERDKLGDDLVPDYMTAVQEGGFYGWPYSYFGDHVDTRVEPQRPDLVARAIVPDYALGAHTAPLGLAFATRGVLPERYEDGAFIGQHGSWNRSEQSGYRVIFVPFHDGQPDGPPEEILTGFLDENGDAYGRPVGVAIDDEGALLVADDVGNTV